MNLQTSEICHKETELKQANSVIEKVVQIDCRVSDSRVESRLKITSKVSYKRVWHTEMDLDVRAVCPNHTKMLEAKAMST